MDQGSGSPGEARLIPIAISVTVITWASAFAGIRAALTSYSPEAVALFRYLIASLILLVYAGCSRMPLPHRRDLPGIVLLGFLGFSFYNVALNMGEVRIPAGTASLLIASAPVFVALLGTIVYREWLPGRGWVGIGLSFIGVAVISIDPQAELGLSSYALLVLAASFSQSIYITTQKTYLRRYTALQFTTYAIWAGTGFLLVFMPDLMHQVASATRESTLAILYLGIFPGVIGYACWSFVLSRLPASRAGSFLYLIPALAILIAWLWLGEIPDLSAWLGGVMVVIGVALVNLGRKPVIEKSR